MRRHVCSGLALLALGLLIAAPAHAGGAAPLPALDGRRPGLRLQVDRYTGGTNGKMVVTVRNPGSSAVAFDPQGLYFVPEGDPEKAPQRLGAAGPFEVSEAGTWKERTTVEVPPRGSVTVQLQVFCIDSHRSSPTAEHRFRLASERLPANLRRTIHTGAAAELSRARGRMPAAKSAIQSHIWSTRDQNWIKLQGERKQEKQPQNLRPSPRRMERRRYPGRAIQQSR
jgi:hypothetical protein